MQSWQTDLLNLQLSLSMKPMLRRVDSIDRIRRWVNISDRVLGPAGPYRVAPSASRWLFRARSSRPNGSVSATVKQTASYFTCPGVPTSCAHPISTPAWSAASVAAPTPGPLMAYYRLAPEHPFPACLEDAVQAYRWLLAQDIEPENIIIAGDSAGGGLTLSTLLALKSEGLPLPACAYMLSPLLDVSDQAPSRWKNALSDTALPAPAQRAINPRPLYLGASDPEDPMVSPINGDFAGLPALYIQVSDSEMLLDDSLRLARRCHTYDCQVNVDIWRKVPHVWQVFGFLPESNEALEKAGHFMQQHAV